MLDPVTVTVLLGSSRGRGFLAWSSRGGAEQGSDAPFAGRVGAWDLGKPLADGAQTCSVGCPSPRAPPGCSRRREARGRPAGNSCPRAAAVRLLTRRSQPHSSLMSPGNRAPRSGCCGALAP